MIDSIPNDIVKNRIHFYEKLEKSKMEENQKVNSKKYTGKRYGNKPNDTDYCRCKKCNTILENDDAFIKHVCNNLDSTEDNVPIDPTGNFECPICSKKYLNLNLLGEHFLLKHNNYEEYMKLDEKINAGFPGFYILRYIEMIKRPKIDDFLNSPNCLICDIKFFSKNNKFKNLSFHVMNKQLVNYYSDDDRKNNKKARKKKISCTLRKKIKRAVKEKNAIIMNCCNKLICRKCLENYLTCSNNLICMFCKKDHTVIDQNYVTVIEINENIDMDKWKSWRNKHQIK